MAKRRKKRRRKKQRQNLSERERYIRTTKRDFPAGAELFCLTIMRTARLPDFIPIGLPDSEKAVIFDKIDEVLFHLNRNLASGDMNDLSVVKLIELAIYDSERSWLDDISDFNSASINYAWNNIPIERLVQVLIISGMTAIWDEEKMNGDVLNRALEHREDEFRNFCRNLVLTEGEEGGRRLYREILAPFEEDGWWATLRKPLGASEEDLERSYYSPHEIVPNLLYDQRRLGSIVRRNGFE